MESDFLKTYYEKDADRFWNPNEGMVGRDLDIYPLLKGLSGNVIEYGCGSGSLILNLAKEDRFSEATGVDISQAALDSVANAWNVSNLPKDKLKLIMPEKDQLPNIPDETYDVVISVATVEHVINPYVVLDELLRIAKPNATLICSVPNYAYIKHVLHLLVGKQPRTGTGLPVEQWREDGWDGMHLHTFTKSSFNTLLEDCGWQPEFWTGAGEKFSSLGFGYLRRKFPGTLSGELITRCKKK